MTQNSHLGLLNQSGRSGDITGNMSISDISAIGTKFPKQQDDSTSKNIALNQSVQKQNFEYKDEMYFRGEKIDGGDRKKAYQVSEDDDEDDLGKNFASNIGSKVKRVNFDDSMNISTQNANNSISILAKALGQL